MQISVNCHNMSSLSWSVFLYQTELQSERKCSMMQKTKFDRTHHHKMCQPWDTQKQFPEQRSDTPVPQLLSMLPLIQISSQFPSCLSICLRNQADFSWLPVKSEVMSCVLFTKCPLLLLFSRRVPATLFTCGLISKSFLIV